MSHTVQEIIRCYIILFGNKKGNMYEYKYKIFFVHKDEVACKLINSAKKQKNILDFI